MTTGHLYLSSPPRKLGFIAVDKSGLPLIKGMRILGFLEVPRRCRLGSDDDYEVEFVTLSGEIVSVVTVPPQSIRLVGLKEIAHARMVA
jgi:hypothetical protein